MNELIQRFRKSPTDTGSSSVQIIILTHRINLITGHAKTHPKDLHCRRGLMSLISNRRALLAYLKKKSLETYLTLIQALGLRH